jgi:hypothetical protein
VTNPSVLPTDSKQIGTSFTAHETETSSKQVLQTSSELAGLSRELALMVRSNGHQSTNGLASTAE